MNADAAAWAPVHRRDHRLQACQRNAYRQNGGIKLEMLAAEIW